MRVEDAPHWFNVGRVTGKIIGDHRTNFVVLCFFSIFWVNYELIIDLSWLINTLELLLMLCLVN